MSIDRHEPTNDDRAGWAQFAIDAFVREVYARPDTEDSETILGDLMANLMHWCDRNGVDFDTALQRGRGHYDAEVSEEEENEQPVHGDRNDLVNRITDLLGSGGSRELAERTFDLMREQGQISHNGRGLTIDADADVLQIAATLTKEN